MRKSVKYSRENDSPLHVMSKRNINSIRLSSSAEYVFGDFTSEETFFIKEQDVVADRTNSNESSTIIISNPKAPEPHDKIILHKSSRNPTTISTTTTKNVKMSLVTITQQTILSTLTTSINYNASTTTASHNYFSPPKNKELSESEERADSMNSYNYNEEDLYNSYNPEIGIRIALALGSMVLILILYLIWQNSCSSSRNVKLDMEFWLNYVDKKNQKKLKKDQMYNSFDSLESLQLPDKIDNSNQATANWILEHQYLIDEMPKIPNKYYLTELNTRHEDNYVNKEHLLFKEKINFPHESYEDLVLNSLNFKINFTNPFKSILLNRKQTQVSPDDQNSSSKKSPGVDLKGCKKESSGCVKKVRKSRRNCYQRRSWPVCNNDYLHLYNMRNKCGNPQRRHDMQTNNCTHSSALMLNEKNSSLTRKTPRIVLL